MAVLSARLGRGEGEEEKRQATTGVVSQAPSRWGGEGVRIENGVVDELDKVIRGGRAPRTAIP